MRAINRNETLISELKYLETSVGNFLQEDVESVYITNIDQQSFSIQNCYCLIIEHTQLTYIEKSTSRKCTIRLEIPSCDLYQDDRLMAPTCLDFFVQKIKGVFREASGERATVYENLK